MIKHFSKNLRSERLELKHLIPNMQNAEMIYNVLKQEKASDYKYEPLMFPNALPESVQETLKMMKLNDKFEKNNGRVYYLFYNRQFIGVRKLYLFKETNTLKLSTVWIVSWARKMGFAKESYRLLEDIAFNKLKVNKIMRVNISENKISALLAKQTGFILDGVSRQAVWMNGKFYDLMLWSKLYTDYKKEKNNHRK